MINWNTKIFIYSNDFDLCNSISLLLQSKYQINYSTNSINYQDLDTDLIIIDVPVADGKLLDTLKNIKTKKPQVKILLLYIYRIFESVIESEYRKYSDLLLYKPIDVTQLTFAIESLINKKKTELSNQ